jgi:hypothetical protein
MFVTKHFTGNWLFCAGFFVVIERPVTVDLPICSSCSKEVIHLPFPGTCITSDNNCKVIKIPATQKLLFAYCDNYAK